MSGVVRIARPGAADIATVRELAPLAADLMIRCGPFDVPVAVLAASATLEQEDCEEGRIARDFVRDDPWHGMGSVHPGGWLLLARDDDTVVIGQREGRVGIGHVVELELRAGTWDARSMGGWHLRPANPRERIEAVHSARARGTLVTVDRMTDEDRALPRFDVHEGPDDVHILLHSTVDEPAPTHAGWNFGVARSSTASFELRTPLAGRRLLSEHRIPPVLVPVTSTG